MVVETAGFEITIAAHFLCFGFTTFGFFRLMVSPTEMNENRYAQWGQLFDKPATRQTEVYIPSLGVFTD